MIFFQSRFCSNLGLPNSVQKAATHIARKAVDLDLTPGYVSLYTHIILCEIHLYLFLYGLYIFFCCCFSVVVPFQWQLRLFTWLPKPQQTKNPRRVSSKSFTGKCFNCVIFIGMCNICKLLAVYNRCNCDVSEIGDIAGVAEVTIRQSYKLMYPKAHLLFPEDFDFVTPIEQLPAQWGDNSGSGNQMGTHTNIFVMDHHLLIVI